MMFVMFVVKYNSKEEMNLDQFMNPNNDDPKLIEEAYGNELYRTALKLWLPFFNKRGFIDNLLPHAPSTPFVMELFQKMAPAGVQPAEMPAEE